MTLTSHSAVLMHSARPTIRTFFLTSQPRTANSSYRKRLDSTDNALIVIAAVVSYNVLFEIKYY